MVPQRRREQFHVALLVELMSISTNVFQLKRFVIYLFKLNFFKFYSLMKIKIFEFIAKRVERGLSLSLSAR